MTPELPAWAVEPLARITAAFPQATVSVEPGENGRIIVRCVEDGAEVSTAVLLPPRGEA